MDDLKGDNVRHNIKLAVLSAVLASAPASATIKKIDVPPSRQAGLDMILVDEDNMPEEPELARHRQAFSEAVDGAAIDPQGPVHPLYTDLRRQLDHYRERWSGLPQLLIGSEASAIGSAADPRVSVLRERLGLPKQGGLDKALEARLKLYQAAHGLGSDGRAGPQTIASLNRGAAYYEQLIQLNLERARRLPTSEFKGKYILVDAGAAKLFVYENGRVVDTMKVVVGAPATETPMLAAALRYSSVNPYWNVPPALVRSLIAPKVLAQGMTYLSDRGYEVFDDWSADSDPADPTTIDWQAVAAGERELRVRQRPGGANSMGKIKFMMPNDYGIYLHDTPNKALFEEDERWVSNGCIRVEDAARLARWLYGEMPQGASADREEEVALQEPVPVYVTYFTVASAGEALSFRKDRYDRDSRLLGRFRAQAGAMTDPGERFRNAMAV